VLGVGEFASIGRVTVRLLHYYDEIGLLHPARVDPSTGYRWYEPDQVPDLTRILQLRDFGLRLDDIARVVHGEFDPQRERDLLEECRARLADQLQQNTLRLQRLEAYLRAADGRPMITPIPVELQRIPPQRVAYAVDRADGWGPTHIGPVIGPLFDRLADALVPSGIDFGPGIAVYEAEDSGGDTTVRVTAAFAVDDRVEETADPSPAYAGGFAVTTLPPIEEAAVVVHRGPVATIDQSWHALMDWVQAGDLEMSGVCREVYRTPGDEPQQNWVTDLQQPVRRR
jgi:DNA-binding transcriptional MerR regulator/effector-binding domain-containing protein